MINNLKNKFFIAFIEVLVSVISSFIAKEISLKYERVMNWGEELIQKVYPFFIMGFILIAIISIIFALHNIFLIIKDYRIAKQYQEEKEREENLRNLKKKIKKKNNT